MNKKDLTCAERVQKQFNENYKLLSSDSTEWQKEEYGEYSEDNYSEFIFEYGVSFDYVESNTDYNPDKGYYRWQLSWGGPSDEFRFYVDDIGNVQEIEYWFLDWFDGASITLTNKEFDDIEALAINYFLINERTDHLQEVA